jgi:hypothetical protein
LSCIRTSTDPALKEEGGEMFVVLVYFDFKTCVEQFEERSLGEVVDLFQLNSNSTTPSANRRTPLLERKRRGKFVVPILFVFQTVYERGLGA